MMTAGCERLVTTHSLLAYQEGLLLQNGAGVLAQGAQLKKASALVSGVLVG